MEGIHFFSDSGGARQAQRTRLYRLVSCSRLSALGLRFFFFGAGGQARWSSHASRVRENQVCIALMKKKVRAVPHTLLRLAGMGASTCLGERIRALGRRMLASADEWASDCRWRPSGCPTQWWCLPGVRRSHRGPVHDDYRGRGLY